MFLYNYFLEIKNRFVLVIVCYIILFIVCYFYKETLLFLLVKSNQLSLFYFISTDLTDVLNVYLDLSNFVSIQLTILSFLYHALTFFLPGLFFYEYQKIKFILFNSLCFVLISVFLYNVCILPCIWLFFLSFNGESSYGINIFFESRITEYVELYKSFYFVTVLISQMFVIFIFSTKCVTNKVRFVAFVRKIFYFVFLMVATITTPPDVFSQLILVLVFVFIFEVLVLIVIFKDVNFF